LTGAWASPAAANIKDATITDDPQHTIPKLADRINRMAVTSAATEGCIRYATNWARYEQLAPAQPPDCRDDSRNLRIVVF